MNFGRTTAIQLSRFVSPIFACAIAFASAGHAQTFSTGWESNTSTSLWAAGRILNQTTFGPRAADYYSVEAIGIPAYVAAQLNEPAYLMPTTIPASDYAPTNGDCNGWSCDPEAWWWQDVLFGQDQLRQRVAFALSKLFVVSYSEVDPRYFPFYLDALSRDAFGNWSQLMQDVSLSGAMGTYLNMANSLSTPGAHADENFARELMQLFSIGTVALNQDGSFKLDANGNQIPNYTPAIIQAFARAYTGYTFANNDCSTPTKPNTYWWPQPPGAACPMAPLEQYHDTAAKTLLRGVTLPAGQSAEADVQAALNNVFQDPSLPPFVCRRLIQSLVKSNPSPAYISRIAAVFINDGTGVRGNLKAVISAILLDSEARADDVAGSTPQPTDGLMRDPILWYTSVLRATQATYNEQMDYDGIFNNRFGSYLTDLEEDPHNEPSVFSYYSPDFTTGSGSNAVFAPEMQLENTESLSWLFCHGQDMLDNNFNLGSNSNEFTLNLSATSGLGQVAAAGGPTALVNALDALLLHGTMTTEMRDSIIASINMSWLDTSTMVKNAVYLVVTSPQYRTMI